MEHQRIGKYPASKEQENKSHGPGSIPLGSKKQGAKAKQGRS